MSEQTNTPGELKKRIDDMSYEDILRHIRFDPIGHPMHPGEVGTYFFEAYKKKRVEVGSVEAVRISKLVGWSPL